MCGAVRPGLVYTRAHVLHASCLGRVVRDDIGDDDGDSDEDGIRMAKYGTGQYSCANNKTEE